MAEPEAKRAGGDRVRLDTISLGRQYDVEYALGPLRLEVLYKPQPGVLYVAELRRLPDNVYDLVVLIECEKPPPAGDPKRAFYFFIVYIVVHQLSGRLVAKECPALGLALIREGRAVYNDSFYGNNFRLEEGDQDYYVRLVSNSEYLQMAERSYGWTRQSGYGFRGMGSGAGIGINDVVVLFCRRAVVCKDRVHGQKDDRRRLSSCPVPGLAGREMEPGEPLAAVGAWPEKLAIVPGAPAVDVLRVQGVHSMVARGAKLLFRRLAELAFAEDGPQRVNVFHPEDPVPATFAAIVPYAPLDPMDSILCWDLGALPANDRNDNLCLVNPALLPM